MEKILEYHIDKEYSGQMIREFLKDRGYSQRILAELKRTEGGVLVDTVPAYLNRRLSTGETLSVLIREESCSETILPVKLPLTIVYEDEDLLVINKAAGVPVHPSQGNYDNTLANAVAYYFLEQGKAFVFRAVNRLDRDTTGLLLVAKHSLSAAVLSSYVAEKKVCREYLAAVSGKTEPSGTICLPIARRNSSTIERCVDEVRGEYACTHYRRLLYNEDKDASLLHLVLDTGRTHQIRVHLKAVGHPLFGDFLYNPDYRYIARQSLHSYRLTFPHPITGEKMEFTAPVPEDFYFLRPLG